MDTQTLETTEDMLVEHVPFAIGDDVIIEYLTPSEVLPDLTGKVVGVGIMHDRGGFVRPGVLIRRDDGGKLLRITSNGLFSVTRKEA